MMFEIEQASNVRKEWSFFIDKVLHEKPAIIKRHRDSIAAFSMEHLKTLLSGIKFPVDLKQEQDETWTAMLKDIDLAVNAKTKNEALKILSQDLMDYADEYMDEFEVYYRSRNRKNHFPYIVKVLLQKDQKAVLDLLDA
jgi:hypothetical protein